MLILKHVEYEIENTEQLEELEGHLRNTTEEVDCVSYQDIYFVKEKKEFILFLECESEEEYLKWRKICPPPPGAIDWYEVLLNRDEYQKELVAKSLGVDG
jgi:hypothetical protein